MNKKPLLAIVLAVLFWTGSAQAQDFSLRLGLQLLTIPSVQIGSEISFGAFGLGSRVTAGTTILFTRVQLDGYVFVPIGDNWQVYFGLGAASFVDIFNGALNDFHGLLGVRLSSGVFLEFVPRLFLSNGCNQNSGCQNSDGQVRAIGWGIDFGLGFAWRL